MKCEELLQALQREHRLAPEEWAFLLAHWQDCADAAMALARQAAVARFGTKIFFRGIIEFTSHCRNDCLYCGLRRSNQAADRYRLTQEEILACCAAGYALDFRTFVLQGGGETLEAFLAEHVFADAVRMTLQPDPADVEGFRTFLNQYKACLRVEQAATENL